MAFLPSLRRKAHPASAYPSPIEGMTPEQKVVLASYYGTLLSDGVRVNRRWDSKRTIAEGYERVVWVFRSVEVIAGNASRLPVRVMDGDKEVTDHPLTRILGIDGRANPLESGREFRKRLSAQILLSKPGAFVEVTRTMRGYPRRMDLLPLGRTEIIAGTGEDLVKCFKVVAADGTHRYIEPERVRWFREPHPEDPYSGVTPLESSGLSVELDHFADLYNANFMRNDGRPGGILAVKGPDGSGRMPESEAAAIESRFGKGPAEAGKMTVISGEITYVDPVSKPRDVAYAELSDRTKIKTLTAFGLDESIIGDTSGSTFANADQAWQNFWLLEPMPSHLALLTSGFNADVEEGLTTELVTEDVEPLQRARSRLREEARAEFEAGLRSIKSYADLAGYGDEVEDTPHTRALWISQGKTPLPAREEDAEALGVGVEPEAPAPGELPPDAEAAPVPPDAEPDAPDAPAPVPAQGGRTAAQVVSAVSGRSAAPAAPESKAAPQTPSAQRGTTAPRRRRARPTLLVEPVEEEPDGADETDAAAVLAAEALIAAALLALSERYTERTAARLQAPKMRKGTRHFTPEYVDDTRVGTVALDTARAVDEDTWDTEARAVTRPYIEAAAAAAAAAVLANVAQEEPDESSAGAVAAVAVAAALLLVGQSARRQARALAEALNDADQSGVDMAAIVVTARGWKDRLGSWARGLATHAAVAATEGARDAAVQDLIRRDRIEPRLIRRTWITQLDDRVRPSHVRAQSQTVGLGQPFVVGGALLRYPGDPLAPVGETGGCRCRVRLTVGTSRFSFSLAS